MPPSFEKLRLAILHEGAFSDAEKAVLLTALRYTDFRTHVCKRSRWFIVAASGVSPRRARLALARAETLGLLERVFVEAHSATLDPRTPEYASGAMLLRWTIQEDEDAPPSTPHEPQQVLH